MPTHATAWFLDAPKRPLVRRDHLIPDPGDAEAVVEIEACGVCHTDLGFADGSVTPKHALPLVLGHEIVGRVVAAGASASALLGRRVLVPAVLPCGRCVFCRARRANACTAQKMPGNDVHGGFATHLLVPSPPLAMIDEVPSGIDPRALSVVADAVSTAFQATRRAGLATGDVAFVVGAGGVGTFVAQIAHALGARVFAVDVDRRRLEALDVLGVATTVDAANRDARELKKDLHARARALDVPSLFWRIFECSGTPPGQQLAFSLLSTAATMVQIGFTPKPVELRLSNVMAFDATIHGTWGCPPDAYAAVLDLVFKGQVKLDGAIEHAPMSTVNDVLARMADHSLGKRMVLDPRA